MEFYQVETKNDFCSFDLWQKLQNCEDHAAEIKLELQELLFQGQKETKKLMELQQLTTQSCTQLRYYPFTL